MRSQMDDYLEELRDRIDYLEEICNNKSEEIAIEFEEIRELIDSIEDENNLSNRRFLMMGQQL